MTCTLIQNLFQHLCLAAQHQLYVLSQREREKLCMFAFFFFLDSDYIITMSQIIIYICEVVVSSRGRQEEWASVVFQGYCYHWKLKAARQ